MSYCIIFPPIYLQSSFKAHDTKQFLSHAQAPPAKLITTSSPSTELNQQIHQHVNLRSSPSNARLQGKSSPNPHHRNPPPPHKPLTDNRFHQLANANRPPSRRLRLPHSRQRNDLVTKIPKPPTSSSPSLTHPPNLPPNLTQTKQERSNHRPSRHPLRRRHFPVGHALRRAIPQQASGREIHKRHVPPKRVWERGAVS